MFTKKIRASILGTVALAGTLVLATEAKSDTAPTGGADQVEFLSTPDRIISVAGSGAPTNIWQTLEHGEAVQCMDCIGAVAPLLYDANAKNREISAWWLRRRTFGVFGPGEVYSQTIDTLATDTDPTRRAYAASALGEFLDGAGIQPLATALMTDSDPGVRASAASALGRINDDGAGALTKGLLDTVATVQVAAMEAAGRVSTISDQNFAPTLVTLLGSTDALVRKHAVQLIDEDVRIAACHALGAFRNTQDMATLQYIATNDSSSLVRDMATIALQRL
jgi:hypothetical protein